MDFSPITIAIFIFAILASVPGALAIPKKKTAKKTHTAPRALEVYSALEEIDIEPEPPIIPKISGLNAKAQAPTIQREVGAASFYTVPSNKTEQLSHRIRLVEAILVESGRAYDYRAMTTPELESILKQIRADRPSDEDIRMLLSE